MDFAILQGIQDTIAHPVLDALFSTITHLGQAGIFWILVGLVLLCIRKYRFWGIVLLVALAAVGILNEVLLKWLVARPRPFIIDTTIELLVPPPSGYSFPSGHTGTAFAAATVLGFSPLARGWKIGAWILALLLAFSRMYLQVHFPTDVLAGAILGVIYGVVCVKICVAIARKRGFDLYATHEGKHARENASEVF